MDAGALALFDRLANRAAETQVNLPDRIVSPLECDQEALPMALESATEIIPLSADAHGVLRVGNTRVTLDTVIAAFSEGATAEEIVQQYSALHLADVYSVIGYSLRHTSEVDAYLQQRQLQRDNTRQQNEARFDPCGVRDRLLARRAARGD